MPERIAGVRCEHSFALIGFSPINWNSDFTPWPAPGLRKDEPFLGLGSKLLDWMLEELLPFICERYANAAISIMGYSLGGLMALWCCYETDVFSGCASCSGSLWYDSWLEYAATHHFQRETATYLSLGESEEKVRNQRLARVGDATRQMAMLVEHDPSVTRCELCFHPGGHFNDPEGRVAEAIRWLIEQ